MKKLLHKTQPRTLTNCPELLLIFCGSVPGLTTCLPLIWVKNCLKLLQIALSYDFANCVKSLIFANYQRTINNWQLVQIPYGSPHTRLSNDGIMSFEGFSFTLIRLVFFTCPLYSFGLSFGVVVRAVLLEVKY